jgi:hypothetical protein
MLISPNNEGKLEGLIFTLVKFFVKAAMSRKKWGNAFLISRVLS